MKKSSYKYGRIFYYGLLVAVIGQVLSHTYRPYVYENHINDFHLADVIGSVVCVPAAVLCAYGILSDMSAVGNLMRQIDGKFGKFSFCAVDEYSSFMRLYYLIDKVQAQSES